MEMPLPESSPPERFAVRVTRAWYPACASAELGRGPIARTLLGVPIVLFRTPDRKPAALLDRCAHRNVPLSLGRLRDDRIECAYHGWQYTAAGRCAKVPGLCGEAAREPRAVPAFAVRERDGLVWVYATPDVEPPGEPFAIPPLGEGATEVRRIVDVEAPLHATLENALDVPHTAVLHRGLFRGDRPPVRITARVSRTPEGLQAEYVGEPRPEGWAAKILSPSGGVVVHFDRFILPSIAQVEYRLGEEAHFRVDSICSPVDDAHTRIFAVIGFRTRLPGWLVKPLLAPVATRIFRQDAFILKAQADSIRRFGREQYASTAIDVLGLQILRLLRRAESGDPAEDRPEEWTREIELEV
jgi:phenylpropionate dioxygenase-like ring-hydroxylating dioxygenase large terminal subunit